MVESEQPELMEFYCAQCDIVFEAPIGTTQCPECETDDIY